jgi:HlyD family type I secretion membrane fusion protein
VHTIGGVIAPGQVLMDIVPRDDRMTIDARIHPNDIDSVHAGQDVQVVLLAYPQRQMPVILGTLASVSADSLVDESGDSYFLGKVEVAPETLSSIDAGVSLLAGMEVELRIMTEERTFLDYVLEPIVRSFRRSFVET